MSLKLIYYGQNDGSTVPDVALTGDPGTDQAALTAAGYLGGRIMALKTPVNASGLTSIVPCDGATMVPFGALINGPGEFAGAIGPSGSKKAPVVRAFWQGNVNDEAYDTAAAWAASDLGKYLYCGEGAKAGLYTKTAGTAAAVGICTHVPTTAEPWLGVASLL